MKAAVFMADREAENMPLNKILMLMGIILTRF
jgi:hypothetical protein